MKTEITTIRVPVSGGTIAVRRRGGHGPTLVLLHYWGGSAGTWNEVIEHLPTDRDVVVFDQRGWGRSRSLPGPYDLDQLADDVTDIVEGLALDSYVLVGHSMGGKVSQIVASRRPAGLAAAILLAPAPAKPAPMVTAEYQQTLAHAYDSPETVRMALDQVLTATALDAAREEAVVRDSLAGDETARREWPSYGIAADITGSATKIEVPVLILAGESDRVEPPAVLREHLLPYIRQARFEVIGSSGHLLPLEAPAAVAEALAEFSAAVEAAA